VTTKELHAKLSTKLRTRRKGILKLLAGVAFASLVVFAVYSAIAVLFAFLVQNPDAIRKLTSKSIYETEWKAENYFSDPKTVELCRAIEKQDVEEMQRIVDSGADVNAKGKNNMPLLLWAYPAGEQGMECLLKNGADPNVILESSCGAPFEIVSIGSTLLHTAVISSLGGEAKFENYVDLLLKYGADPNLGDKKPLLTASTFISNPNARKAFFSLINAGADINHTNGDGRSPVVLCIVPMSCDLIPYLLERGAVYETNTPQGFALQRVFYEIAINNPEKLNAYSEKDRVYVKNAIKWLEERGVSFDEPAPEPESLEKP
jgi:ankyrin repeat protein